MINHSKNGAISELRISAILMKRGWDVFRSLSPESKADLVACKNNVVVKIDSTTCSIYVTKEGATTYLKPHQTKINRCIEHGILCVAIYDDDVIVEHTQNYVFF